MPPKKTRYLSSALGYCGIILSALYVFPFIFPRDLWWLAVSVDMLPPFIFFGFILFLSLVVFQSQNSWAKISLVLSVALLGLHFFLTNRPTETESQFQLKVMTSNMGEYIDPDRWLAYAFRQDPDVMILQEFYSWDRTKLVPQLEEAGYQMAKHKHQVVASKFPIEFVDAKNRRFLDDWGVFIGHYQVQTPFAKVNVYNVHLESPRDGFEAVIARKPDAIRTLMKVVDQMDAESSQASQWVEDHPTTILAGDFNMTTRSPLYRKYWNEWQNAFDAAGWGLGFTKYTLIKDIIFDQVRIDHFLTGSVWRIHRAETGPELGGDHRPIMVQMSMPYSLMDEQDDAIDTAEDVDTPTEVELPGLSTAPAEVNITPDELSESIVFSESFETSMIAWDRESSLVYQQDHYSYVEGSAAGRFIMPTQGSPGVAAFPVEGWSLADRPHVSLSYKIPSGVGVRLEVQTEGGDWYCVAHSLVERCPSAHGYGVGLQDNGQWQDLSLNIKEKISAHAPDVQSLSGFRFVIPKNRYRKDSFWLDDIIIE